MGLTLVGYALFQRFYLPSMQEFIESEGWRAAWLLMGASMALFVLPLLGIFLRDRPEDFGLVPDGKPSSLPGRAASETEDSWTLVEAMRTPMFWVFTLTRLLAEAWATALIFHQLSLFEKLGYTANVATSTFGSAAVMIAAFTLLFGWLVNRLRPGYLIAVQLLGLIGTSSLALFMTETWLLFLYPIAFGIFVGVGAVFDGAIWVTLFGRQHQGSIRGFVATSTVIGTGIGTVIFGLSYDYLGSYSGALWLGMLLAVCGVFGALSVKKPSRPAAP